MKRLSDKQKIGYLAEFHRKRKVLWGMVQPPIPVKVTGTSVSANWQQGFVRIEGEVQVGTIPTELFGTALSVMFHHVELVSDDPWTYLVEDRVPMAGGSARRKNGPIGNEQLTNLLVMVANYPPDDAMVQILMFLRGRGIPEEVVWEKARQVTGVGG